MLSSDKMSEIRQPVLSLQMKVGAESALAEHVHVDMTKDELDNVLRSMVDICCVKAERGVLGQAMQQLRA
jgi:hypothetical protein